MSLGKKELRKLVDEQENVEVCCHFCDKKYTFETSEVEKLMESATK